MTVAEIFGFANDYLRVDYLFWCTEEPFYSQRLLPFLDNRSGKLSLRLWGPVQEETPRVYAFVDLTRGRFTSGLNHEPLQLQLPKDFTLEQEPARVVAFELMPADFIPPKDFGSVPGP